MKRYCIFNSLRINILPSFKKKDMEWSNLSDPIRHVSLNKVQLIIACHLEKSVGCLDLNWRSEYHLVQQAKGKSTHFTIFCFVQVGNSYNIFSNAASFDDINISP